MTVVSSQPSTTPFELRNATLTLMALVLRTTDLAQLATALEDRFGATPALFEHEPVVINLSEVAEEAADIDFAGLVSLLRARSMVPVGVEGGSVQQMAQALEHGLGEASTLSTARPSATGGSAARAGERAAAPAPASTLSDVIEERAARTSASARARDASTERSGAAASSASAGSSATSSSSASAATGPTTSRSAAPSPRTAAPPAGATRAAPASGAAAAAATAAPARAPAPAAPGAAPTMVLDRPLRSGQQVYARGGDLVVMAAVNFGAEVIADGHIHVYAPLRGRAIAGARGNIAARIFSTCMEPQLISIAGVYRTAENSLPGNVLGKPAQVRLDGDTLIIEALGA
jgi:septum site-determining protein MinC